MAPTTDFTALLGKRDCARDYYGNCYSGWYWYGRWIFAAVVVIIILAIFFLWACVNSRRRRRQGMQPMYGTGWMATSPQYGQYGQYQNSPAGYNTAPPPAYGAPPNQQYPMQPQYTAEGYYGQREGVQQPKNNGTDFAPPEGPPPAKTTH